MSSAAATELAREIAAAHGAHTLAAADHITVSFSSGGLAFAAKGQPAALADVDARLHPTRQQVSLTGSAPVPWTLRVADGDELQQRLAVLRSGARRRRWQPEDLGAFAAAALWTYLTLPLLVDRAERLDRPADDGGLRRLRLQLPPTIAGHSRVQTLHVGLDGLIHRHDYTATAFGAWARATQRITSYETFDGVPVGTTRRVTPRLGTPLPFPTLVWIEIHDVQVVGG